MMTQLERCVAWLKQRGPGLEEAIVEEGILEGFTEEIIQQALKQRMGKQLYGRMRGYR